MRPVTTGHPVSAALLLLSLVPASPAFAQMRHSTAPADSLVHVFAVVPLIGSGTPIDPKRPMFAPAQGVQAVAVPIGNGPAVAAATPRSGIIGYHMELSDDGNQAIVEFMAVSKADLQAILTTSDSRVQVFVKGEQSKDAVLAAFQAIKKDFSFDKFLVSGVR
jgi:hypothetical protein